MKKYITLLMCIAVALVSVACNLSTSAGANVELTQPADQLLPTATNEFTDVVVTEEPSIETEEPDPESEEQPANSGGGNVGQLPPTAILPEVTLPLLDAPGQPPSTECTVRPTQAGTLINVRRGASLNHEAFMQLKTFASVIAEVNGWYQIPLDGGFSGYVSSTVTTLQGNCAFLNPPPDNLCTVRPTQSGGVVNVRRGADSGYEVILQLSTWAAVKYEVNGWYGIDIEGPHDGFVSSSVTTLHGDCAFLYPTPIPTRDSSRCYLDIPLAAGIEVPYFSEPQRYGTQQKGIINTTQLLIRGEKAGWYDVISYQGTRGWVPANIGNINGNCSNIPTISYDGTICIIVAYNPGFAYYTPFTGSDQFGPVSEGLGLPVMAKVVNNWYGYDNSGNVNPTAEPLSELRWVRRNESNRFYPVGDCDEIPIVYDEVADWDIAIETAGDPPAEGCSVQTNSTTPPWINYIYTGVDFQNRTVIGVLNTYAPFVSLGDFGYVIELPDGNTGWVSDSKSKLVGAACPA